MFECVRQIVELLIGFVVLWSAPSVVFEVAVARVFLRALLLIAAFVYATEKKQSIGQHLFCKNMQSDIWPPQYGP